MSFQEWFIFPARLLYVTRWAVPQSESGFSSSYEIRGKIQCLNTMTGSLERCYHAPTWSKYRRMLHEQNNTDPALFAAVVDQLLENKQACNGNQVQSKQGHRHSLLENLGGLSLTSLRVMLMVVVPASPPSWPPMSLAWINTWYCSFTSLSMLGRAVFMTPGVQWNWWEKKYGSGE